MKGMYVNLGRVSYASEEDIRLPCMVLAVQQFASGRIDPDRMERIAGDEFNKDSIRGKIRPGMRIAVGVGSKGIENIARIVKAVVAVLLGSGGLMRRAISRIDCRKGV